MDGSLIGFVCTTDTVRAKAFYVDVLGLSFVQEDGFALVLRSGSNMVRLVKMESVEPPPFTVLGWEVESVADHVAKLTARGVQFLRYPWFQQDEAGIWTAPNGDRVAWFHDPDGNTLSLSQH